MTTLQSAAYRGAVILTLATMSACSQAGSLGSVLGSVLGGQQGSQGGQGGQVSGAIQRVDTRAQQITIQQSNGQAVSLGYDKNTKVVYQNQQYAVSALEYGDQVTARVQNANNGAYYTDLVQVDQSVSTTTGGSSGAQLQTLQGVVRRVDTANGWFLIDANNGVSITVSMPYSPSRTDLQRFQNLRTGDNVRLSGVYLNNSRVELRQFL